MKKWLICVAAILLAAALTGCAGVDTADRISKLTVSATETVLAKPDTVTISFCLNSPGRTADEAQGAGIATVKDISAAIHALEVADENIQTSAIRVEKDSIGNLPYDAYQMYTVKTTADQLGKVIDAAVSAGADESYSLAYELKDQNAVYLKALGKATASAEAKAREIAGTSGHTIDRILEINEDPPQFSTIPVASTAIDAAGILAGRMNYPNEIQVSATVNVTYLLK